MAKIDLKQSYDDMGPAEVSKEHYPSLHWEGKEELGIPDEGTATITYKVVSCSNSESEASGKRYSYTIDVKSIESTGAGQSADDAEEPAPAEEEPAMEEEAPPAEEEKPKKKRSAAVSAVLGKSEGY